MEKFAEKGRIDATEEEKTIIFATSKAELNKLVLI
jgi:hypothetical protein